MKHIIIGWEFKNGKIIVTMNDPNRMYSDGHGNYDSYYYEKECTNYYGLLEDDFDYWDGDQLTGLSYEEWIKTIDYDDIIKRCAGRYDSYDVVGELLGIPKSQPINDDSLPF